MQAIAVQQQLVVARRRQEIGAAVTATFCSGTERSFIVVQVTADNWWVTDLGQHINPNTIEILEFI